MCGEVAILQGRSRVEDFNAGHTRCVVDPLISEPFS